VTEICHAASLPAIVVEAAIANGQRNLNSTGRSR